MSNTIKQALHDLYKAARIVSDGMKLDVDKFIYEGSQNSVDDLREALEHCMWDEEVSVVVYPKEDGEGDDEP